MNKDKKEMTKKYLAPPSKKSMSNVDFMRIIAYRDEADPLFFRWKRDEATEEEWRAKIEEIKARYPKDEE